jgi:formate hydrogenlyase transcriptional activator
MGEALPGTSATSAARRAALRGLLEAAAAETGQPFFRTLVRTVAGALDVRGAWITEYLKRERRLRALAFWLGHDFVDHYEYPIDGTACEPVVENARVVHIPERALELYPGDPDFVRLGAVSYLGVPLLDIDGDVLGHLAVLDTKPLPEDPRCLAVFQMLAGRAASELSRLRSGPSDNAAHARTPTDDEIDLPDEPDEDDPIVGRSAAIRQLRREIDQVAATDATVLIVGETGTGKELVARALHAGSRRARRALVAVNCGALPDALVESELFGHERGAFTGATERREGRFSLADGGTIFLDEIGDLPLPLQVKLLRVLQEGQFEPLGSSRTRTVDVRVVAATNRDLKAAVQQGQFRGDLYFRLNVFPIRVPPLRERGSDVLLLADVFARQAARRMGRRVAPVNPLAAVQLSEYHWPGNVRELQNVIERAVITSTDGTLNLVRMLPEGEAQAARRSQSSGAETAPAPAHPAAVLDRVLAAAEIEELERHNLCLALEQSGWRVSGPGGAAALLGLKPSTLASRMKALGIRRP